MSRVAEARFVAPFRRAVPLIVAVAVWGLWLSAMTGAGRFGLFRKNYFMSITMLAGSFIAGATSEGGGAVAFPVMTLLFKVPPPTARDFSLMIQSVGMSAASLTILAGRIRICTRTATCAGPGGVIGVVLGLELVSELMPPSYVKMFFTSLWLSFAVVLFWLNRDRDRLLASAAPRGPRAALALFFVGVLGGIVSGVTGSGVDILTFSLLVLSFRVSESIATPTSVVLMAMTAVAGALYRGGVSSAGLAPRAWDYWWVCVPIVVVGAPFGARFIKSRSREWICGLLATCIAVQFVGALMIIPQSASLLLASVATLVGGVGLFGWMQATAKNLAVPEKSNASSTEPFRTP